MRRTLQITSAILVLCLLAATAWAQPFSEAPSLAARVAAGELPPVEERLPLNPAVMVPIESIGTYSDTIFVFIPENGPWNTLGEEPERGSYLGYIQADTEVVPNLAESFKLADDFTSLTIHLREGAKWSDGRPFTADDIIFAFDAWHFDSRVNNTSQPFWMNKVRRAIRIDDYTVRLETDEPFPPILAKMGEPAGSEWHAYLPRHYMEQFHIDYNPDASELATELGFETWELAFEANDWEYQNGYTHLINDNQPRPTMQPWTLVEVTDTSKVSERNPFFWKVDPAGQQLPYIERIVAGIADPETIQLKIISGETDLEYNDTVASTANFSLYKQNEAAAGYTVHELQLQGSSTSFAVNQTIDDPIKRPIFQDLRFRQALSLAIDADEINEAVFFGLGRPMTFAVTGTSFQLPDWDDNPMDALDVDRANELLDAVGLEGRNSAGWRLGPDGEVFTLIMEGRVIGEGVPPPPPPPVAAVELIKEYWEEVGLQTEIALHEGALYNQRRQANLIGINVQSYGLGSEVREYMVDRSHWVLGGSDAGWAILWGDWLEAWIEVEEGTTTLEDFDGGVLPGEEPPQWAMDLFLWGEERSGTVLGSPEYLEVSQRIFGYHFENLLFQGVVGGLPHLIIAKTNLGNVPQGFFGSAAWYGDLHIEAEQLYFKTE